MNLISIFNINIIQDGPFIARIHVLDDLARQVDFAFIIILNSSIRKIIVIISVPKSNFHNSTRSGEQYFLFIYISFLFLSNLGVAQVPLIGSVAHMLAVI